MTDHDPRLLNYPQACYRQPHLASKLIRARLPLPVTVGTRAVYLGAAVDRKITMTVSKFPNVYKICNILIFQKPYV